MSATAIFTADTAGDGYVTVTADSHGAAVVWDDGISGWEERFPSAAVALMRAAVLLSLGAGDSFTETAEEFAVSAGAFLAAQGEEVVF